MKCLLCLMGGGVPLITGARSIPGISFLWAGAPSLNTASSHQATVVSVPSRWQHKSDTMRFGADAVVVINVSLLSFSNSQEIAPTARVKYTQLMLCWTQ